MPTIAEVRRLEALEAAFGAASGSTGVAVVELPTEGELPKVELDDFDSERGVVVLIRSGAIAEGEFRATVNGEWRAGLPPFDPFAAPARDYPVTVDDEERAKRRAAVEHARQWLAANPDPDALSRTRADPPDALSRTRADPPDAPARERSAPRPGMDIAAPVPDAPPAAPVAPGAPSPGSVAVPPMGVPMPSLDGSDRPEAHAPGEDGVLRLDWHLPRRFN